MVSRMEALDVDGAWVVSPRIYADRRGSFLEWFRNGELRACLSREFAVAQGNCSVSRRGVIRGIHFADVPPGQAKYVTCVTGSVLDVVVDLRVGSPGFGRWAAVPLNDETRQAVFVAEGLGHGLVALSEEATILYLCSAPYRPGREHGVHPLDPDIGIAWPSGVPQVLSDKDAAAPSLAQARSAGLLPDYLECLAHVARCGGAAAEGPGGGDLSAPAPPREPRPPAAAAVR
jgi:dTDP-4-dehydrorhamnose 3,5-epimerase